MTEPSTRHPSSSKLTGDVLIYALELGMPVHYLSGFGKHLGSALPAYSRNGQLRLVQYRRYEDQAQKLELVKAIVTTKIYNQATIFYRHGVKEHPLKQRKASVAAQKIDQVRGWKGWQRGSILVIGRRC